MSNHSAVGGREGYHFNGKEETASGVVSTDESLFSASSDGVYAFRKQIEVYAFFYSAEKPAQRQTT